MTVEFDWAASSLVSSSTCAHTTSGAHEPTTFFRSKIRAFFTATSQGHKTIVVNPFPTTALIWSRRIDPHTRGMWSFIPCEDRTNAELGEFQMTAILVTEGLGTKHVTFVDLIRSH